MRKTVLGLLMFVTLVVGCANTPVYDDSKSVEENLTALEKGLTPDEVELLKETIGKAVVGAAIASAFGVDVDKEVVKSVFTGKTARQIVDDAKLNLCKDAKNAVDKAERQIKEQENLKKELAKVQVKNGKLFDKKGYFGKDRYLHLDITNNFQKTLKNLDIYVMHKTKDRDLPWFEFRDRVFFKGGLQTGEVNKTDKYISDFKSSELHDDADTIVTVIGVTFADDQEIELEINYRTGKPNNFSKVLEDAKKDLQDVTAKWGCQPGK